MPRRTRQWLVPVLLGSLTACQQVPYTERHQYDVIPSSVMRELGRTSYVSALQAHTRREEGKDLEVLRRVGGHIALAVPDEDFAWEYALLVGDQANAWALPGGYIAFYTGILPALRNEAGMAFVMGHEVGHAVANHSAERLSQQLSLLSGLQVLDLYLSRRSALSLQQRALVTAALGLGVEVGVLLPYSRLHEHEADVLGMMYMAQAGYPPEQSVHVWDRMAALGEHRAREFLSTHPTATNRQGVLHEWLPRARKVFERNALPYDTTRTLWPVETPEEAGPLAPRPAPTEPGS